ncbi:MAG: protein kinase domain-containing protein [Chloroflexota bacterium]
MADGLLLNNRYRLLAPLGAGGMATVYRGEDTLLGRPVAVKVLHDHLAHDKAFLARFHEEARAAASLSHPHIVGIFDVGEDAGRHYIVMEYVDGPTLKDLITQQGLFPVARTVEIAAQVLSALDLAHQKGLIHRDIKPQNVLVTADGQAKVADFGIARLMASSSFTQTGEVFGTPLYLAPERASGKEASAASDVYAVGVLLYEMLTGGVPFSGETPVEVALKHIQQDPLPPRHLNPAVPPRLEQVVLKAMAKDPALRFTTAAEMRQSLLAYEKLAADTTASLSLPAHPAGQAGAGAAGLAASLPAPAKAKAGGFNWLMLVLLASTAVLVALTIAMGSLFYDAYLRPWLTNVPAPTVPAVVATSPTPTPSPTITVTPTPSPTTTPQATATPTATPTPQFPAWMHYIVVQRDVTQVKHPKQTLSEVRGQIVDQNGKLVPGLRVMIEAADGRWKEYRPRPGIDQADGTFSFDQLSPGTYKVTIVDDAGNALSQTAADLATSNLPDNFKGYVIWTVTFRQVQ